MFMITILLADDHALVHEGLRRLLQDYPDLKVVRRTSDDQETLRGARQYQPDVILMDLSMHSMDGVKATRRIVAGRLESRVFLLSMDANDKYAVRVLQAGAPKFVGKGAPSQKVTEATRKVASEECHPPTVLTEALPKRYVRRGTGKSPLEALSDRELQVLQRLAEGQTGREIAQDLHLSPKTVDTYRTRLLTKLELSTTADLIRFALRHGVVQDTP